MSHLGLGDLCLDPRRALYLKSLQALVLSDLHDALALGDFKELREMLSQVDEMIEKHEPKSLVLLGDLDHVNLVTSICRRWGKKCSLYFVSENPKEEIAEIIEVHKAELHQDLVWGAYRFLPKLPPLLTTGLKAEQGSLQNTGPAFAIDFPFTTITALGSSSEIGVRVGKAFSGIKLSLFLKGMGLVILPSFNPKAVWVSVLNQQQRQFDRFDAFAVGHHRVLPMGKVLDLEGVDEVATNRYLMVKRTLNMVRKASIIEEKKHD